MSDDVQETCWATGSLGWILTPTLLTLARQFVAGQRMLAAMQRGAQMPRAASPEAPEVAALCEELERVETTLYKGVAESGGPVCGLAIEVFETFGPGLARGDDDTDAIWNNKFFVWLNEFSVAPTQ